MITKEFAEHFSKEWIKAWNAHDVPRVLTHYTDDFEMSSPYIVQIAGIESGKLIGKAAIGAYWQAALAKIPDLQFELVSTLIGVDTLTLYYKGARGMAAEVFFVNAQGKIWKAMAHYV